MGIISRLFRLFKSTPEKTQVPSTQSSLHTLQVDIHRRPSRNVEPDKWIASSESVIIAGIHVNGGVYVGSSQSDPSTIDPNAPVQKGTAVSLGYYPSYQGLTPAQRFIYLSWLANGRHEPSVDIGYVFLFFYGLERRVITHLLQGDASGEKQAELSYIRTELSSLLSIYGRQSGSFQTYASELLEIVEFGSAHQNRGAFRLPELEKPGRTIPVSIRAMIGLYSSLGKPIPAPWALRWAWYFPETRLRTPALRLPELTSRLFAIRYQEIYGDGLEIAPAKSHYRAEYYAANSSLRNASFNLTTFPNTFELKRPARKLVGVLEDVTKDLDAHSRWIGRNSDNPDQIVGLASLPPEIIPGYSSTVDSLESWIQTISIVGSRTILSGQDIISRVFPFPKAKLTKAESIALAHVLGAFGIGIEPDVRLSGVPVTSDAAVVLFRSQTPTPLPSSAAFDLASVILHLAATVTSADGVVSPEEIDAVSHQLRSNLQLSDDEEQRLFAHLIWLSQSEVKLSGMKRRLSNLEEYQRESVGRLLIEVAASNTSLAPSEVAALERIFQLLNLDIGRAHSQLHSAMATEPDASPPSSGEPSSRLRLNKELIERTQAETNAVNRILADIFQSEDEGASISGPAIIIEDESEQICIDGLDGAHHALFMQLIERDVWSLQEVESMCRTPGLMPSAAIETINEFALDSIDDLILEVEGDSVYINAEAREELMI